MQIGVPIKIFIPTFYFAPRARARARGASGGTGDPLPEPLPRIPNLRNYGRHAE